MCLCVYTCVCGVCVCVQVLAEARVVVNPLELELHMLPDVGVQNQTQALCNSIVYSQLMSYLSVSEKAL